MGAPSEEIIEGLGASILEQLDKELKEAQKELKQAKATAAEIEQKEKTFA